MKPDQIVALLASLRMSIEAQMAQSEALLSQVDAVMRGFSNAAAALRCPVCGSERLINADTLDGPARVCDVCTHSFAIEPAPESQE